MTIKESINNIFNVALDKILSNEAEFKVSKDNKHCFEVEGFTATINQIGKTTYTLSILNRVKDIPLSKVKEVKEYIETIKVEEEN